MSMGIKEWWWNKLYSWQRHSIILFTALVIGDFIVYNYIVLPFGYPTVAVATFNFMLNALALIYAVYAYYLYDKQAEKESAVFKELGIEPPSWKGVAKYLAIELRTLIPTLKKFAEISEELKKSGIEAEDMRLIVQELKNWIDRKKQREAAENALKELDGGKDVR